MVTHPGTGYAPIRKPQPDDGRQALLDYAAERQGPSWSSVRATLDGLPGGRGLNIAHEAVDRHAAGRRADQVAIRWLGRHGQRTDLTYGQLARQSSRFANVLRSLGVGKGERVFTLLGRVGRRPEAPARGRRGAFRPWRRPEGVVSLGRTREAP